MTNQKESKEKWYYHEMIVCTVIVLGIFGLMFGLIKLGVSVQNATIVGGIIFLGFILLPLIEPIQDIIKWLRKQKTKEFRR